LSWLEGVLDQYLTYVDLLLFIRLYQHWATADLQLVEFNTRRLQAMRESQELLAKDRQMGNALSRLLLDLGIPRAALLKKTSFATMYALAC